MLLLLAIAVVIFGIVAWKTRGGKAESKEDRELKSRAGAAVANALPPVFGGQASSSLPEPDMTDRMDAEDSHVVRVAAPARLDAIDDFGGADARAAAEAAPAPTQVDEAPAAPRPKKRKKPKVES